LNITGASAAGGAGVAISFGGGATVVSCGSSLITLSLVTTPTSLGTSSGDTMTYTLPVGLAYAGNLTAGFTALVSGGSGSPTIVKIPMPVGIAPSTPINYSFDAIPSGGGCGSMNIGGAYQRRIASLLCGSTACASSSVVISTATSPAIVVNKPNLVLSNVVILDTPSWRQANWNANHVKVYYSNNGSQAYSANSDTVEFFCNSGSTVAFAKRALTKNVAVGSSDSDEYYVMMPIGSCIPGDVITARIQTTTSSGTPQCLCSPSSYVMSGVGLPLGFLQAGASSSDCSVRLFWQYNQSLSVDRFEIQRSGDASLYQTIATLDGRSREYRDISSVSGNWYYRIVAVSTDGKRTYSKTLIADSGDCPEMALRVFPNPVQHQLTILGLKAGAVSQYKIIDHLGRNVLQGELVSRNTIDVSMLSPGFYILKVIDGGKVEARQVQICR
jgi:hypothetical protein